MEFGILSRPGVLLLARFFRHKLYVSWSKYVYRGLGGLKISAFVYDKSFYIMPKVLSNSTCTLRKVIRK